MKKIFTLLAVGACACLSVTGALNWNKVENLAKDATVTASSNQAAAQSIVDNNDGSGWQAIAATHDYTNDWVLIDLGAEKTFTDIEIIWQAAHCTKYSIYTSTEKIPYTEGTTDGENGVAYKKIEQTWLDTNEPAATGGNNSEDNYTENIEFKNAQTAQYVLIMADEYNNYGGTYGMFIYEVRLADIADRDAVSSLSLTCEGNAIAGGDAVTVTVTPLSTIGEALGLDAVSELKLTCDNDAVTIEGGENGVFSVRASKFGDYTLTATAKAGDNTVTGEMKLIVAYNWTGINNIATHKTIQGRVKTGTDDSNPPTNAVDGNVETYYQYDGDWVGGEGWLLVDLGDVYDIEAIGALYTLNANGQCMFGYATEATAIEAKIKTDGTDFRWADLSDDIKSGWTFTPQVARSADVVTTYAYPAPVLARYIVVNDADNSAGKPAVNEIYVSGSIHEAAKATTIDLTLEYNGTVIGEANKVTAAVLDQYGEAFDAAVTVTVAGANATYADGVVTGNAKGMVTVTATVEGTDLSSEVKFFVADENDYCMQNVEITASDGAAADKAPVTDGGKVIDSYGVWYVLADNEPAGNHEHWILVKLDKVYTIDLIAAIWEGAAPADYDIYLGTSPNDDDLTLYYSERNKKGMDGYSSDRFSGKEMKDISYIKIVTTKNATDYGIKLYDLKVYGTSKITTIVDEITAEENGLIDVYNLQGIKVRSNVKADEALIGLPGGIYIAGGRKVKI